MRNPKSKNGLGFFYSLPVIYFSARKDAKSTKNFAFKGVKMPEWHMLNPGSISRIGGQFGLE
jgi:hypothetical protein